MTLRHNQNGFGAFGAILVVLVLGIIGLVGYRVTTLRSDTSKASTTTQSSRAVTPQTLAQTSAALDATNVDASLNTDSLGNDISALL